MSDRELGWVASWVWLPEDADHADSYTWFRCEVEITADATPWRLFVGADQRYRLWVNGRLIGDGPPPSTPESVYYDVHDLTRVLRPGKNCLALAVRCVGGDPPRRPGLIAELQGPSGPIAATGRDIWRCRRADAWARGTATAPMNQFEPHQEVFDARLESIGWREPGFDDSGWSPAVAIADPAVGLPDGQWSDLRPRPIPRMEEHHLRPVRAEFDECLWLETRTRPDLSIGLSQAGRPLRNARVIGGDRLVTGEGPATLACTDPTITDLEAEGVHDPCVLLDFGTQQTAYVEFDVEGPAGSIIDLGVAERLVDGHFNNAIEGQFAARYVLRQGRQRWRTMTWRGFRYLRLRIRRALEPVIFHDLHAVRTRYPLAPQGSFVSADPRLNSIFEACRDTIRLCAHESIMDTPWREQAQWLGDVSAVTAPAIRTLFADTDLVEKFLDESGRTVVDEGTMASISNARPKPGSRPDRDIPDYALWWVIDLARHFAWTGDAALVRDHFGTVRRVLDGVSRHLSDQGALSSFAWTFIDWADVDTDGECAALTAIFHGALRAGCELAELIDATADRQRWADIADRLRQSFERRFWSDEAQAYVDAVHPDGHRSTKISEHANFAAIRFGLIDGDRARALANRILGDPRVTEAQPFFTSVVLDGLHRIGLTAVALDVIDQRWGRRMIDRDATTCYEEWGRNGSYRSGEYAGFMRTESHAWSAHPATFLITSLAGIEIAEPGRRRLRIDPYLAIDYSVRFPTPHGPVMITVADGIATVTAPEAIMIDDATEDRS